MIKLMMTMVVTMVGVDVIKKSKEKNTNNIVEHSYF